MALVKCPECAASVSSAAAACPKCGHPIAGQSAPLGNKVQTVELTGKKYKAHILLSGLGMSAGAALFFAGILPDSPNQDLALAGGCVFGAAFVWWVINAITAWWHHG